MEESKKKIIKQSVMIAVATVFIILGILSIIQAITAMGIVIDKFINNPMKHQLDRQKLEIEILKLESQVKDSQPEEEAEDNFMDALNGTAAEVWEESEVEEE